MWVLTDGGDTTSVETATHSSNIMLKQKVGDHYSLAHLNLSAMRELAAGLQTASPRAMPTLSTTSCQNS